MAIRETREEHHNKELKGKWYLDCACSNHMIRNKNLFKSVVEFDGGIVRFGDNSKGTVVGIGTIVLMILVILLMFIL